MAKSKSFFGLRRGSTKTLTFQVNAGKQITKDRVEIVKNPRTQSQMTQRMVMATASAAYTAMKQICNHSFEGVSYGQESMSKFISINAKLLRENLSAQSSQFGYNEYRDRGLKVGAYQLSDGTLPTPAFDYTASSGDGSIELILMPGSAGTTTTVNEFASYMGLSIGEMATICVLFGNAAANGYNFGYVRVRFKQESTAALTLQTFQSSFDIESSMEIDTIEVDGGAVTVNLTNVDIADTSGIAKAPIYSRQGATGWLRSKAVLSIPNGMVIAPTASAAIATYPVGTDYVLNGGAIE